MDFKTRTTSYLPGSDHTWLASAHATDTGDTITLNLALFTAGTHFPDGFIPAGMALGKVTATGKYGPYDNAAGDGRTTLAGHLLEAVRVDADNVAGTAAGTLLRHGQVREARLPANHGVDAAGKADVAGHIIYV